MATLAELLRQGADRLVELPNDARRFMTNPQAFTQLVTGKNPMPRETGFAAGAMSLPPTEMSVLDPNQAPYMQGYEQGEPFGIAAMALPFAAPAAVATAKALAPKAGMMAENYMVKQGMIQPITTWHASPHRFEKFDPAKVGTGEGAQSYGVGAGYVAENPKVAGEYYSAFTNVDDAPLMFKGKRVDTPWNDEISQRWNDVIQTNKFTPEQIEDFQGVLGNLSQVNTMQDVPNVLRGLSKPQQSLYNKYVKPELTKPENLDAYLYKIDVPDEQLPKMLDWDKPLLEQTPEVQEALAKLGIKSDKAKMSAFDDALLDALLNEGNPKLPKEPINPSGQTIYQGMIANNPAITSQKLQESGITGIRYLDAMSRKNNPKPTSNFVVFDPEHMKILETYSNPTNIKNLLEQEFNKLK